MTQNMAMEMDPLSNFEYPPYGFGETPYNMYPYNVKLEPATTSEFPIPTMDNFINQDNTCDKKEITELQPNVDIKPDITPNIAPVPNFNVKNGDKKKSNYISEKITEKDFPFYGCAVCNISYQSLKELDQHVTTHKGRVTSYDLRVQNQIKKKMKRKELKKLKKLKKVVKKEDEFLDFEIKPEDGYIGNEKATDYAPNTSNIENANTTNVVPGQQPVKTDPAMTEELKGNESGVDKASLVNLQKIYKCFGCEKQFTLSYYLKLHVRSHTDEKPYTCSVCGQSFITASKLGRHNKRIHLAIRHQCRICFKYFSRFEYLTRHFDKYHPDDKLEGEPYDYNAILPYIKELEEELREKAEAEAAEKKLRTQELWPEVEWKEEPTAPLGILVEEFKIDLETEVEIKKEVEEEPAMMDSFQDHEDGFPDFPETKVMEAEAAAPEPLPRDEKEDPNSDEDYFPSNTWAVTPKVEINAPDSPPPRSRRSRGEGPLKCEVCQKTISTASYLRVHMRTHTGERPFKCYICNRGFITSSKMHRHVLTHQNSTEGDPADIKQESECKKENGEESCKEEEVDNDDIDDADYEDKAEKKKPRKKLKKDKSAKGKPKLKKEKVAKEPRKGGKRPFACDFCHSRFLHQDTLEIHRRSHEGEVLVLRCGFCLEEMESEELMKQHESTHTGPKPYLCTLCGKNYKKKETMVYHRKNHKPDCLFTCEVCSKSFNTQNKLQRHIASHRAARFILRYECPVCAHMFHTKYHVQMHLATHLREGLIHEENRNDILAMVLQNARKIPKQPESSVVAETIPPDERSRVCNICGEVFQHFYYLEEHLKSHGSKIAILDDNKEEEKKYTCQVCNKSFKLHYYLKLHSFTHNKERPYICQQCGKGFITKGKLKRHLETHAGLKKYQCHICYKFFTRPSYLRIHVRTIHGTQDYNFRNFEFSKEYAMGSQMESMGSMSVLSQNSGL